jgi:hypothetical protein
VLTQGSIDLTQIYLSEVNSPPTKQIENGRSMDKFVTRGGAPSKDASTEKKVSPTKTTGEKKSSPAKTTGGKKASPPKTLHVDSDEEEEESSDSEDDVPLDVKGKGKGKGKAPKRALSEDEADGSPKFTAGTSLSLPHTPALTPTPVDDLIGIDTSNIIPRKRRRAAIAAMAMGPMLVTGKDSDDDDEDAGGGNSGTDSDEETEF